MNGGGIVCSDVKRPIEVGERYQRIMADGMSILAFTGSLVWLLFIVMLICRQTYRLPVGGISGRGVLPLMAKCSDANSKSFSREMLYILQKQIVATALLSVRHFIVLFR